MKFQIICMTVLMLCSKNPVQARDFTIVPFASLQAGYGTFFGYVEPNLNYFNTDPNLEHPTYRIFSGFDYGVRVGGSILRKGSNIYDESFFDIYFMHKRLSSSSNATGFTGLGIQIRYRFFFAGFLMGMAGNRNPLPVEVDDNHAALTSGNLHGINPMFTLGLRAPVNAERTLFLDIPFDFVFPKKRMNDEPAGMTAFYDWYSFNIGICYYIQWSTR
jgi:hypothetical protein